MSGCGAGSRCAAGIEIGHIFQLGRKYADVFGLDVLGPDGKPIRVTMGSYGIGVTRAVAAIAEQTHDDAGLCWPAAVAPADVHIVAAGKGDQRELAERRLARSSRPRDAGDLRRSRGVSPGVEFKDAELIGMPSILVVGRRSADEGGRAPEPSHRRPRGADGRGHGRAPLGPLTSSTAGRRTGAGGREEGVAPPGPVTRCAAGRASSTSCAVAAMASSTICPSKDRARPLRLRLLHAAISRA